MKMYRMWLDRWRGVFDPCFVMFIPLVPLEEGWLPLMWDMMSKKLPMTRHYDGIKLKLPLTKAKSVFWKAKYDHEAAKKARAAAMAARKTTRKPKKKKTASDLFHLDDASESEDDTGASQAVEEEVTISSDSAPLPRQKLRLVTQSPD
ncbi:uncharacterized protein [Triticum aestivum]|uniref:uncharacterized protein isoform X2 n=1 Tax=Triticum aestivum TaxID=4565 RepID=UPI001D03222E|nr:uncharacterized protein LOC123190954 isoform X2 [Triticum aestivum]